MFTSDNLLLEKSRRDSIIVLILFIVYVFQLKVEVFLLCLSLGWCFIVCKYLVTMVYFKSNKLFMNLFILKPAYRLW